MEVSKVFLLVFAAVILQLKGSNSITQSQTELIDEVVALFNSENNVVGIGLTVVHNGETVVTKGYGKRNIKDDLDVEPDTVFAIGSVSKGVTALLIAKTLSELFPLMGEAVLDTPIAKLGNNLNFTLSDRFRAESVTFRDLLSHRTCLYSDDVIIQFQAANYEEFIYRSRYDTETEFVNGPFVDPCSFRAGFLYNNAMIALAGQLIGELAGTSYSELLYSLYAQIGMNSSRVLDSEGSHEELPNWARAYTRVSGEVVEFDRNHLRKFGAVGGAASVLTTVTDMTKYLNLHLNKGQVNGQQVVRKDVMDWIYKISFPFKSSNYLGIGIYGYGLGLMLGLRYGLPFMVHPGHISPYASWITLVSGNNETNTGIFTVFNGPGYTGSFRAVDMHFLILQILTGEATNMQEVLTAMDQLKSETAQFPHQIDSFAGFMNRNTYVAKPVKRNTGISYQLRAEEAIGLYGSPTHGDMRISQNSDNVENLNINYGEWGIGVLTPRADEVNFYDVEFTTTVNLDFHGFGVENPEDLYKFSVHFVSNNDLDFYLGGAIPLAGGPVRFVRNATLETYPEIPWEADSCYPQN